MFAQARHARCHRCLLRQTCGNSQRLSSQAGCPVRESCLLLQKGAPRDWTPDGALRHRLLVVESTPASSAERTWHPKCQNFTHVLAAPSVTPLMQGVVGHPERARCRSRGCTEHRRLRPSREIRRQEEVVHARTGRDHRELHFRRYWRSCTKPL